MLSFETSPLLKATFLIYVLPILVMIAGAFIGQKMAPLFSFDPSILSAISAFSFFGLTVIFVRSMANKLAKKDKYQPKVIKIIKGL